MNGVLPLLLWQASAFSAADSVQVCVRDAVLGVPVVGARVRMPDGTARTLAGDCVRVAGNTASVVVSRVGYRSQSVRVSVADEQRPAAPGPRIVRLQPLSGGRERQGDGAVPQLTMQRVTAEAARPAGAGRTQVNVSTDAARERGATTTQGIIGLLPYTSLRSARGETGLSLRGARREQVVITLDGLPLNDPATGLADVADVPLAALQAVTVMPGADPVNSGSGANGGVLALTSASGRLASLRSGAFGQWGAEGAYTTTHGETRWQTSLSHRRALNDFAFVNGAGERAVREERTNNDEQRSVLTASMLRRRTQWLALASVGERGMVGPANVRAYDEDRARTTRLFLRGQTALGASLLVTGARHFTLRYRDPRRPALDAQANAWAADAEWRGTTAFGAWRVGAGADELTATGNVRQRRSRGFAAWSWQPLPVESRRLAIDVGARTDMVEHFGLQPTASLGATWRAIGTARGSSWALLTRGAQAIRVPTLYDLYFSSPQRLAVRALDPERVTLDVSTGTQVVWQRPTVRAVVEFTAVSRDTRNAIVWFPGNFGWSPANVGLERLRGTEARADVTGGAFTMSAWHTWYRSDLRSGTLLIPTPYVPQHTLATNAAWRAGLHTFSANVRHQGRRPFTAGPRDPFFELPAVTIADVAWSQRHRYTRVEALWSVTLENVADVQWQSVRGFPMPGRGWTVSLTLSPQA